jgi:hypothetical protein
MSSEMDVGLAVTPHAHYSAMKNEPHTRGLRCPADRAAEQPAKPACIGTGHVGACDQRAAANVRRW